MSVVSSVLSRVSTRSQPSTGWNVNVSFSSLMDSLFSIAFGLGLRFVVDTVSRQDFKLTGTLVGLWEGVILLHFTKKMPKSSDPYIAFAVRLCVDFFLTESVARLVLVLIWTGLGMILADITPAIWSDVGLNRVWRRLRRDLYTISHMVPTVAFFPPQRTVRFSPSHAPSAIGDEVDVDDAASDITATAHTPSAPAPRPDPILPPSRDARKRRVPGHYGFEYSDTETERSFTTPPRAGATSGRTSRRLSVYPGQAYADSPSDSMSSLAPHEDVDAGNLSDGASSSAGTERAGPSSTSIINMPEAQGMEEEESPAEVAVVAPPMAIDTAAAVATKEGGDEPGNRTPTQQPLWIPPTPSDSAAAWRLSRAREAGGFDDAIKPMRPLGEPMPQIPDFLDEPLTEDWTDLGKSITAAAGASDPFTTTTTTAPTATEAPTATAPTALEDPTPEANTLLDPPAYEAWPIASSAPAEAEAEAEREYKTAEDFDDIYGDEAPPTAALAAAEGAPAAEAETGDLLGGENVEGAGEDTVEPTSSDLAGQDPWGIDAEQADADVDAAIEKEAAELARLEQEQENAAEEKRLADEAEANRLAEEEAKRIADEAAAVAEAEAKRLADEVEAKRIADEAAAAAAAAAEKKEKKKKDKKKKEAEERQAKEDADEAARQAKRAEEDAERVKKEEEAKEQKRKDAEGAAERRAQKAKEKGEKAEAARKAKEEQEEADRKAKEEADRKAKEEKEEADRKAKEEEERQRVEKEEADRKAKEEAELKEQEEAARKEKEEADLKEKEEAERKQREEDEKKAQEALEAQQKQEAEDAALATVALDAAFAQEQEDAAAKASFWDTIGSAPASAPVFVFGQGAPAGDFHMSSGFSPEPLVNLDEPATEEPAAATAPAYEESVVSDASAMAPQDPRERVERMMILRAQMVEIQNQIDDLKAGGAGDDSPQLRQMEKIMRKMVRQATRRYAAGIECAQYLNGFDDTSDLVTLENVHPNAVIKKVAEQIESLMSPSARSLHFSVQVAKKAADAKKQKPKVIELIDEFNLTNYTTENAVNKKISEIDIPEEAFGTWLTEYRKLTARRAQQEEEPEYAPWG